MQKFPLLDQLRSDVERHDAEITAPYQSELRRSAVMLRAAVERAHELEREFASAVTKHLSARMADEIERIVMPQIMKASAAAPNPSGKFYVEFDRHDLAALMPGSPRNALVQRVLAEALPKASIEISKIPQDKVTRYQLHMQSVTVNYDVHAEN